MTVPDLNDFHNFKQWNAGGSAPTGSGCLCTITAFILLTAAVGALIGALIC